MGEEHWFEFGLDAAFDVVLGTPRGKWPKKTKLVALPGSRYPDVLMPGTFTLQGHAYDPKTLSTEKIRDLDDLLVVDRQAITARLTTGKPVLRPRSSR